LNKDYVWGMMALGHKAASIILEEDMIKASIKLIFPALFVCILISGCATIMEGKTQSVTFNSVPSGADVYLNGKHLGKTPLSLTIDKPKENGQLKFSKKGYKDIEIAANKKMSSWLLGNIIFGGTFGTSTDYASGALYEYEPNNFQVTLEPEGMSKLEQKKFEASSVVRRYVLMNYNHLAIDLANKNGEYIDSLLAKLDLDQNQHQKALEDLRVRVASGMSVPQFSEYIIKHYL